jgi:hypothetical protein
VGESASYTLFCQRLCKIYESDQLRRESGEDLLTEYLAALSFIEHW